MKKTSFLVFVLLSSALQELSVFCEKGNLMAHYNECSFILKPSSLGGIGVFATHDIPAETQIFNLKQQLKRTLKIKDVPQDFIKYCIYISDEECICPERFDRMEIGWYLNHSDTPNIATAEAITESSANNGIKKRHIYTTKDIKAGDEILIDYNYLNEPEHLKENFYKKSL